MVQGHKPSGDRGVVLLIAVLALVLGICILWVVLSEPESAGKWVEWMLDRIG